MARIVVGISGASGAVYGIRLLEILSKDPGIEIHLTVTAAAARTIRLETGYTMESVLGLGHYVYDSADVGARVASGSFRTDGMVVVPCSMKTVSAIANSYNDNLLVRAADVTLKEKRKLVVVPRETPLHLGHLRILTALAEMGAVVLPPMPAFYHQPKSIDDLVDQTVGKILDQFGIEHDLFRRWGSGE